MPDGAAQRSQRPASAHLAERGPDRAPRPGPVRRAAPARAGARVPAAGAGRIPAPAGAPDLRAGRRRRPAGGGRGAGARHRPDGAAAAAAGGVRAGFRGPARAAAFPRAAGACPRAHPAAGAGQRRRGGAPARRGTQPAVRPAGHVRVLALPDPAGAVGWRAQRGDRRHRAGRRLPPAQHHAGLQPGGSRAEPAGRRRERPGLPHPVPAPACAPRRPGGPGPGVAGRSGMADRGRPAARHHADARALPARVRADAGLQPRRAPLPRADRARLGVAHRQRPSRAGAGGGPGAGRAVRRGGLAGGAFPAAGALQPAVRARAGRGDGPGLHPVLGRAGEPRLRRRLPRPVRGRGGGALAGPQARMAPQVPGLPRPGRRPAGEVLLVAGGRGHAAQQQPGLRQLPAEAGRGPQLDPPRDAQHRPAAASSPMPAGWPG